MQQTVVIATEEILDSIKQTIQQEFALARNHRPNALTSSTSVAKALTFADVARRLRISAPTLRAMLKRGDIEAFRVGSNWRITEDALTTYQSGKGAA
ncbi:MAG: helix-turn-helix domain-containing protein [bacterium]|nr:helix-turn-helix domain-containing protein [bacterium]